MMQYFYCILGGGGRRCLVGVPSSVFGLAF